MAMSNDNSTRRALEGRVQQVLSQRRNVLNFEHYTPSPTHVERMKELAKVAPELYDNPDITPRSKWFTHSKWHENSQMPPFHIHFRTELQSAIQTLFKAYEIVVALSSNGIGESTDSDEKLRNSKDKAKQLVGRANAIFSGSMRGLNGHVHIEEYACFPLYKRCFPKVDILFLYHDHEELHSAERDVHQALEQVTTSPEHDCIQLALTTLLDFDDKLMSHLGEEEEVVVPMSLTDQEIWF